MRKLAVVTALLCLVGAANADWLYLTPVADSTVDFEFPDSSFPTGDLMAQRVGDAGQTCTKLKNFFMQFEMPAGMTGANIASVQSANIEIFQTSTAALSLLYYCYGVMDGLDTASADTYTWNNAPGYDPANTAAVMDYTYYYDPAEAYWIGAYSTRESQSYQMYYTTANFGPMIMADTDGRLTFFVSEYQYWNYLKTWASMESPFGEPVLMIEYTPVPEPVTIVLMGLGAALLRRRLGK